MRWSATRGVCLELGKRDTAVGDSGGEWRHHRRARPQLCKEYPGGEQVRPLGRPRYLVEVDQCHRI